MSKYIINYIFALMVAIFLIGCNIEDEEKTDTDIITHNGVNYKEVISSKTEKVWLDRNLGASQVCSAKNDSKCYGFYYQWGRKHDGHEQNDSNTVESQTADYSNAGNKFITGYTDWTTDDNSGFWRENFWEKTDGTSVCPKGFRIPTKLEFNAELDTNSPFDDSNYNTALKLPLAGYREPKDGNITKLGIEADYWLYDANSSGATAQSVYFTSGGLLSPQYAHRTYGFPVRCIKD
ncbi:MAG: fibrobacter succinogenes major paralogous domain-containing protein [Campylobacterales bacterium]|nr:fibrobacter succinogenes major paralogous domain-containing protein [Campylobacterales bacterium]